MDAKYQHPSIYLYMMDPKAPLLTEAGASDNGNEEEEDVLNPGEDEDPGGRVNLVVAPKKLVLMIGKSEDAGLWLQGFSRM